MWSKYTVVMINVAQIAKEVNAGSDQVSKYTLHQSCKDVLSVNKELIWFSGDHNDLPDLIGEDLVG